MRSSSASQWGGGGGSAQASETETDDAPLSLSCHLSSGVVECAFVSDLEIDADEGVQFTVSVGGTTQTVTATGETNPTFRTSATCGNSEGVCYRFSFTPEQPGDSVEVSDVRAVDPDATPAADPEHQHAVASSQQRQDEGSQVGGAPSTADGAHADTERYPCADAPAYTCRAEAPTGAGVVAVHNDGETVTIDQGNNGVDTADAQYDYDATTPARTREEAEAKKEVRDAVNDIPDDQMVVMTAANGQQSSAEQENAFSLEQQLWDRGEPYMVCFDPVTYTSNGEEITVQPDCVIITPD